MVSRAGKLGGEPLEKSHGGTGAQDDDNEADVAEGHPGKGIYRRLGTGLAL